MFKRSKLRGFVKNMDFILAALTLAAALFGIIMISSAGGENGGKYVAVQTGALFIGIIIVCIMMFLDYEYLSRISLYLTAAALLLLVLVLIPGIGKVRNGARSWFAIGSFGFQPAEIAKIVFIIVYSKMIVDNERGMNKIKTVAKLVGCAILPVVLILVQPDFGTAAVFIFMAVTMLFAAGIGRKFIVGGIGAVAALCPLMWFFVLQDYQKGRILSVFNPESDPTGSGYQVLQSKLAIGSGRIFGAGLYHGPSQLNNSLPERHTDFIFSVICEELGIIGAVLVIILMCAIIIRCILIGMNARNSLGRYMCVGVAAMLIFQTFENIGMCVGLLPITGITLPFFSYGGSSLLTTMMAIGLVMSVKYKSRVINF
ncbi:MAG: rod shape-determining protein RodA [Monoglobaceae bacterium]